MTFRVRLVGPCDSRREPQTTLATPSIPRGGPGLDQPLQGVLGLLFLMRYEYFPTLLQLQKVFLSKPEAFGLNCSQDGAHWVHWCMILWRPRSLKGLRDLSSLGPPGTPEYHNCLHMNEWPLLSAGIGPEMLCGH